MYEELLKLARGTIECYLNGKNVECSEIVKKKYCDKGACFVTLTINNELRGCIGCLEAHQELWKDVIDNAINAGFNDFRFMPLNKEELNKIKIEISVLSVPKELKYKNPEDLLKKIDKNMGIILKKGYNSSTFLPQVWGQIPSKEEFFQHLSRKAGLDKDAWKQGCEVLYYRVEKAEEKNKNGSTVS